MIQIFGHDDVRRALEQHLPPVVLFRGPPSVGKWTLGEYLAQHHGFIEADIRRFPELNAEAAREIKRFASTAPFGKRKYVMARLDGASDASLNALLKLLEEPPPSIAFVLVSVGQPLDTIASRSHVHSVGLLTEQELQEVLVARLGMSPDAAARSAVLGRGQVQAALAADTRDNARAAVLGVLKALADGDKELFELAIARSSSSESKAPKEKWDDDCHELLRTWCVEAITGRWRVFSQSETFGLTADKRFPRKMLIALRLGARPSLSVRVALQPLLAKRRA